VWGTSSLVTAAGLIVGLLFILHSRSEQRELRQSERRFRALIQNSSQVIVLVDASGCTTFVITAIEHVLGYQQSEARAMSAFDLVHPSDMAESQELFLRLVAEEGAVATSELRVRHKDGSWRWIEVQLSELKAIGCILGQGYYCARPLDPDSIASLLTHRQTRVHVGSAAQSISLDPPSRGGDGS
jgi:PAS domain S-box-containing protein